MKESFETSYTGRELELDLLGEAVKPAARYEGKYRNFREAEELVKRNQPDGWDPSDPPVNPTAFPGDLYFVVSEVFKQELEHELADAEVGPRLLKNLELVAESGKLEFWNATGSDLDQNHGTDAFFTLSVPGSDTRNSLEVIATIDVTRNSDKADRGAKADTIIFLPPGASYDSLREEARQKLLGEAAKSIAANLVSKIERSLERRAAA